MALTPGTRLGVYEVIAPIGEGGMGQVYRATDTTLGRQVAIKILPDAFASDPERMARFEREAKTLASLNHPHIAAIYGFEKSAGTHALVMELVEGEDLSQRIARGAIPLDEALPMAKQIAEALEAAHEQGIIHRDLKPANIKVRPDGTVKVLDFGLAKAMEPAAGSSPSMSMSPTITTPAMTQAGMVLGTAAYMSPEQAKGRAADKRSDVWAFGCVLFEMLTGQRAFGGEDVSETLAAVLRGEPDWTALPPDLPPAIRTLVQRCLVKDRAKRIADSATVRFLLNEPTAVPHAPVADQRQVVFWKRMIPVAVVVTAIVASVLTGVATRYLRPAESQSVRFVVLPPEKGRFDSGTGTAAGFNAGSMSPDGRTLAFTARDGSGKVTLWVRPLRTLAAESLPGTDGASLPFWSPDSRSIGFFADGKLKRIEASGGPVQTVSDIARPSGGSWSREDVILFSLTNTGPLSRVEAGGGKPAEATTISSQQRVHRSPSFLPDGEHFTYFAIGSAEESGLFIGSLKGDAPRRLAATDSTAVYSAPGYLLFIRQDTLLAQPFASATLQLTGQALPIAESVGSVQGLGAFSVSETGTLAYKVGGGSQDLQMAWFDRTGKLLQTVGQPGGYISPSLSPDGRRLAVHRHDGSGGDVWLVDGATISRLTFEASQDNSNPIWSPDGRMIAFGSFRQGKWGIYQKPSNGTGDEQLLVESDFLSAPMSWSPDGKYLVYYVTDPKTGNDLFGLPLMGDRKPIPIAQTVFNENHGQVSPDGKWIAYSSNEAGLTQIYVKSFPSGSGKWQASTGGGTFARWRRDSRELFYMEMSDGGRMMSVGVKTAGNSIEFTPPQPLFDSGFVNLSHLTNFLTYDVSPDGQRFLIPRPAGFAAAGDSANDTPITVVTNWQAGLKK